jgi:hypothetical protein
MMHLLPEVVLGIDAGHTNQQDCEQFALDVASRLLEVAIVSIHIVREPGPHYAVAISAGCRPSADVLATVGGDLAVIDRDEYLVGDHSGARVPLRSRCGCEQRDESFDFPGSSPTGVRSDTNALTGDQLAYRPVPRTRRLCGREDMDDVVSEPALPFAAVPESGAGHALEDRPGISHALLVQTAL